MQILHPRVLARSRLLIGSFGEPKLFLVPRKNELTRHGRASLLSCVGEPLKRSVGPHSVGSALDSYSSDLVMGDDAKLLRQDAAKAGRHYLSENLLWKNPCNGSLTAKMIWSGTWLI